MQKKINKNIVIQILFTIAVVFLIANLLIGRFNTENKIISPKEYDSKITKAVTDSLFLSALKNFNVNDSWIHRTKANKKSDLYIYKIDIPYDLPNIFIIKEVYQKFSSTKLNIVSIENKDDESSLLKIMNADELYLSALLNYDKGITHLAGSINLIVILPSKIDEDLKNQFFDLNKDIIYLFSPSSNNVKLADEINNIKSGYGLIIDDNIDELNFEIRNNFSKNRLEEGINSILKAFPNIKLVYFPEEFIPSSKIKNEFKKNKLRTIDNTSPINLTNNYKTDFNKIFGSYILNCNPKDTLSIVLSTDNFIKVIPDLKMYSKLGYRFVTF